MSWINILGFSAALSVLASFCMTTIVALRTFALLSNVLFILYGLLAHIYPVFLLHVVLLPVNLIKLFRLRMRVSPRERFFKASNQMASQPPACQSAGSIETLFPNSSH